MNMKEKYDAIKSGIENYFAICDEKNAQKIKKPYTLSGLLCEIGITRKQFEKLCEKPKYVQIFSAALAKIEAFIEEHALTGDLSSNAASNSLKYNFGWGEKEKPEETDTRSIKVILEKELAALAE